METNVKERIIAKITVDGQTKTIELTKHQRFPDAVLYTNEEHKKFYFEGRALRAAVATFNIFVKALKKEADPFLVIGAVRAAEILDILNSYEEILPNQIV